MAVVDFKKLKKVSERAREVHLIDLAKFVDKKLEEFVVPIRVKSIEECISIKNDNKLKQPKLTTSYKSWSQTPKEIKDIYLKDPGFRQDARNNTYTQILSMSLDEGKIETYKFRERLFNILIHLDMDYKMEDGKDLWESWEIEKCNYESLIDIFSNIIIFENHLDTLDLVIDQIKNGVTDELVIAAVVYNHNIRKIVEKIEDPEEKQEFIKRYQEMVEMASKRLGEQEEEKPVEKKGKKKEVAPE